MTKKNREAYVQTQKDRQDRLVEKGFFNGDGGNAEYKGKRFGCPYHLQRTDNNFFGKSFTEIGKYYTHYEIEGTDEWNSAISSQVSCLNHLWFVRKRLDVATAILKGIDDTVAEALPIKEGTDEGFVAFEIVGEKNYLREKGGHGRGKKSTSIDAVMCAHMIDGTKKLVLIEWKYTECFDKKDKRKSDHGTDRVAIYKRFLDVADSPINHGMDEQKLFTGTYEQLMRQTLLAHEMRKEHAWGADDYIHLLVVPKANLNMRMATASGVCELERNWKDMLKDRPRFRLFDPEDLLNPATRCADTEDWCQYLKTRYWG
jgi:hypothetical protein